MPAITQAFGTALIVLGVGAFVVTGADSPTALLPALVGALLWMCALLARREALRMHAMHAAMLLALLALLGSLPPLAELPAAVGAGEPQRPPAAIAAAALTVLLCGGYLGFGIRSFVQARRSEG